MLEELLDEEVTGEVDVVDVVGVHVLLDEVVDEVTGEIATDEVVGVHVPLDELDELDGVQTLEELGIVEVVTGETGVVEVHGVYVDGDDDGVEESAVDDPQPV